MISNGGLLDRHRLRHGIDVQPVVLDLDDLVPRDFGGVLDGILKLGLGVAVGNDIPPTRGA